MSKSQIATGGIADDAVTTAKTSYSAFPFRNLIINGDMTVAQRATSFTFAHDGTTSAYTLDCWSFVMANWESLDGTVTQSTDAPTGFSKSWKFATGTAEASVDADDLVYVQTLLEAQNLQHLDYGGSNAKDLNLSFWVKSSSAGTYTVTFYAADAVDNITRTYTINAANTWENKTVTIPGNTAGTIDDNEGSGIQVGWNIAAGSNWTATDSTSWGNYTTARWAFGHAQNGVVTNASGEFYLTGCQLELGTKATPFEHKKFDEELNLCKRYYQKSYGYSVAVSTATYSGAQIYRGNTATTVSPYVPVRFEREMRAVPTIVLISPDTGTLNRVSAGTGVGGAQVDWASGLSSAGRKAFMYYNAGTPSTNYYNLYAHFTADASITS